MRRRIVFVFAGAAAVVGGATFWVAQRGSAAPDSEPAQIAFLHGRTLYLVNADGSGRRSARLPSSAVWSHNGRWVVFPGMSMSPASGYTLRVYIARRDGSSRRRIIRFRADPCFDAHWSPDDARIAYSLGCDADFMPLFVAGRRGGPSRLLAAGGYAKGALWAVGSSWSPDGNTILVAAASNKQRTWRLTLLDPAGSARQAIGGSFLELGPQPWTFLWSRDGKRIFFVDDEQASRPLYVINRRGGSRKRISPDGLRIFTFDLSPDGTTITFAAGDGDHRNVYVMSTSGDGVRKLTDGVAELSPSWSPDGQHIVFERVTRRTDSPRPFLSQIYVMNADGSGQRNVSQSSRDDTEPRWLPAESS